MKLQSKLWMLAAILFVSINVSAQTIVPLDENAMYFTADELPDATVWLPAPPDTLSTKFVYDVTQYMWGKTQREDPQRAQHLSAFAPIRSFSGANLDTRRGRNSP